MKYNEIEFDTYFKNYPNNDGYFGRYGGSYISDELKKETDKDKNDDKLQQNTEDKQ